MTQPSNKNTSGIKLITMYDLIMRGRKKVTKSKSIKKLTEQDKKFIIAIGMQAKNELHHVMHRAPSGYLFEDNPGAANLERANITVLVHSENEEKYYTIHDIDRKLDKLHALYQVKYFNKQNQKITYLNLKLRVLRRLYRKG